MTGFDELRPVIRSFPATEATSFDTAIGPCVVESAEQLDACAEVAARVGATYLRGGATKLRTASSSFAGLGEAAWPLLAEAATRHGLKTVSEVTTPHEAEVASERIDLLQIGARTMWNFDLLRVCAASGRRVMLKRGFGATTLEWLCAAERLLAHGCKDLVLCERGLRGTDAASRNAVDLSVLVFLATECPLPVWLDVSHSSGDPDVALAMFRTARALGVDGVMLEAHPRPRESLCDADQAVGLSRLVAS